MIRQSTRIILCTTRENALVVAARGGRNPLYGYPPFHESLPGRDRLARQAVYSENVAVEMTAKTGFPEYEARVCAYQPHRARFGRL